MILCCVLGFWSFNGFLLTDRCFIGLLWLNILFMFIQRFLPKFNTHFRLIVAVTVLSSFFLWALCPTNFILFVW